MFSPHTTIFVDQFSTTPLCRTVVSVTCRSISLPAFRRLLFRERPRRAERIEIHDVADRFASHRTLPIGRIADRQQAIDLIVVGNAQHLAQFRFVRQRKVEYRSAETERARRKQQILHGRKRAAARRAVTTFQTEHGDDRGTFGEVMHEVLDAAQRQPLRTRQFVDRLGPIRIARDVALPRRLRPLLHLRFHGCIANDHEAPVLRVLSRRRANRRVEQLEQHVFRESGPF